MPKPKAPKTTPRAELHQLTVRIEPELQRRLDAYATVVGRSYRDLTETAIDTYLRGLKLDADQQRKVRVLLE
jgi:predicted transcriptional regulator